MQRGLGPGPVGDRLRSGTGRWAPTQSAWRVCVFLGCVLRAPSQPAHAPGRPPLQGTSMATPVTAGSALLVRQYFMDGFYPSGGCLPGPVKLACCRRCARRPPLLRRARPPMPPARSPALRPLPVRMHAWGAPSPAAQPSLHATEVGSARCPATCRLRQCRRRLHPQRGAHQGRHAGRRCHHHRL